MQNVLVPTPEPVIHLRVTPTSIVVAKLPHN